MNNFGTLAGYELKKILVKKPVIIFLVLALAFNIFSCFAMVIGGNSQSDYGDENVSNYESMLTNNAIFLSFNAMFIYFLNLISMVHSVQF